MTNNDFKSFVIRAGLLPAWVQTCKKLKEWGIKTPSASFRKNLAWHRVNDFITLAKRDPLHVKHLDRLLVIGRHRPFSPLRGCGQTTNPWESWKSFGLYNMGYGKPITWKKY